MAMSNNNRLSATVVASCLSALFISDSAFAQLEEVIVTAQRREQNLQEVPISVTAVTAETVAENGMWNMLSVADFVPNLTIGEGMGGSWIATRGLATLGLNPAFEQSTGVFQDGIYAGKTRQVTNQFLDVDRIEVLRGPQPTYFGQGSIAGAISVISARPGDVWEGYFRGSAGTDDEYNFDVAYGGPISETVGIRVAFHYYDTEGYFENSVTGINSPATENLSGRITIDWAPSDTFDLSLKLETARSDALGTFGETVNCNEQSRSVCAFVQTLPQFADYEDLLNFSGTAGQAGVSHTATGRGTGWGPLAGLAGAPFCPTCGSIRDVSAYADIFDGERDTEQDVISLTLNWDLGFATLTSQSAYQDWYNEIGWELDGTPAALFGSDQEDIQDQFSQELRLTSQGDGPVEWMAGLYYQQADFTTYYEWATAYMGGDILIPSSPLGGWRHVDTVTDDEWSSIFGAVTWNISDTVSLDIGARYTDVDKFGRNIGYTNALDPDGDPTTADIGPRNPRGDGLIERPYNEDSTDPSIAINFDATDNSRIYVRYAEGFKAGGFGVDVNVPADNPATPVNEQDKWVFDSEQAEMLEFGIKSQWDNLILNVAIFNTDFDNLQVSNFDTETVSFTIQNAAKAHSDGIEVDGTYVVNENLNITFSGAILDAAYDSFPSGSCSDFEEPFAGEPGSPGWDAGPAFDPVTGSCDRSGRDLQYASDWSATFGLNYGAPVGNSLRMSFSLLASFYGDYLATLHELDSVVAAIPGFIDYTTQPSYEIVNLRLGIGAVDGRWEAALYGRNMTDTRYNLGGGDGVGTGRTDFGISHSRGESYGLQFNYNLGQ